MGFWVADKGGGAQRVRPFSYKRCEECCPSDKLYCRDEEENRVSPAALFAGSSC
jgi:hypothetical protein